MTLPDDSATSRPELLLARIGLVHVQLGPFESLKATPSAEPLYRITVALDRQSVDAYGRPQPLTAGMQLEADVLLDRRHLIEWLFEPLLGLTGRLSADRGRPA